MYFHLIVALGKDRRSTFGAKMPARVTVCDTGNFNSIHRENRRCIKQRPVVFAAIHTMTNTRPIRGPMRHNPHLAADAPAVELFHVLALTVRFVRRIDQDRIKRPLPASSPEGKGG